MVTDHWRWCCTVWRVPSRSHYAAGIMHALRLHGWRSVLLHFRGCSGAPNRLARGYHAGETGDLDYVVRLLRQREPLTPLAVVGYSLGGNVLLKWLGEQGAQAPIIGAVAVSVPFTLANAAVRLNRGVSRLYQWSLLHRLRASLRQKWHGMGRVDDVAMLDSLHSLHEFDDRVTAPLHGFAGADDYYAQSSSRGFLHRIRLPTLILQSRDDPFMTPDGLPESAGIVCMHRLRTGGQWRARRFRRAVQVPGAHAIFLKNAYPPFLISSSPSLRPRPNDIITGTIAAVFHSS